MVDTNTTLAELFDHMADLYVLRSKPNDNFRQGSYRRIANTLRGLPKDIKEMVKEGEHKNLPGVGPAIQGKIEEYLETGKVKTYEELKAEFPKAIIKLMSIPSLGPKKVQLLWKELGVENMRTLKKALKDGSAEALPGFGKKSVENILEGIEYAKGMNTRKSYETMVPIAEKMRTYLQDSKLATKLEVAGSFRREEKTIGDLDFLAVSKKPEDLIHYFISHPDVKKVLAEGKTKGAVVLKNDQQVDLRVVEKDQWGAALQYFTGSKDHNVRVRSHARAHGMTINEYGVFMLNDDNTKGKKLAGTDEKNVYKTLGLAYPDPTERKGEGLVEAL